MSGITRESACRTLAALGATRVSLAGSRSDYAESRFQWTTGIIGRLCITRHQLGIIRNSALTENIVR